MLRVKKIKWNNLEIAAAPVALRDLAVGELFVPAGRQLRLEPTLLQRGPDLFHSESSRGRPEMTYPSQKVRRVTVRKVEVAAAVATETTEESEVAA